ncbi:MAG TPA: hypothetical protein VN040_00630, partial [Pseudosphingobacterium sp.]|nr:hypothetical protein [Pseudosphingobacterium sp.]
MKKPIKIHIPEKYKAGIMLKNKCPFSAFYKLTYAECNYWKKQDFSIIEQYYDAKDVFIGLTEIRNRDEITIPFDCERYDLYWLYQLKGHMELFDRTGNRFLRINNGQYMLTAMPKQQYYAYFKPGKHLLCYFVVKSEWLLRHDGAGLYLIDSFLEQLRQKERINGFAFVQESLSINPIVRRLLLSIFTLSKPIPISLDTKLYERTISLLVQSLQDLTDKSTIESQQKLLVDQIRLYVQEQLAEGPIPSIKEITEHFEVSRSYLWKYHQQYYGIDLQQFITEKKLGYSYELLIGSSLSIA